MAVAHSRTVALGARLFRWMPRDPARRAVLDSDRWLAPSGDVLPTYQTILLAPNSQADAPWPLALNQLLGKHRVRGTDGISGTPAKVDLDVGQ